MNVSATVPDHTKAALDEAIRRHWKMLGKVRRSGSPDLAYVVATQLRSLLRVRREARLRRRLHQSVEGD